MSPLHWLAIACGGALGAVLRSLLVLTFGHLSLARVPLVLLSINVTGCFCAGVLLGWHSNLPDNSSIWQSFLQYGLLGAFTTFSAFALEAIILIRQGWVLTAVSYMILSLVLCVIAATAGYLLTQR